MISKHTITKYTSTVRRNNVITHVGHSSLILATWSVLRYMTLSFPGSIFHMAQLIANRASIRGTTVTKHIRNIAGKFSLRASTIPLGGSNWYVVLSTSTFHRKKNVSCDLITYHVTWLKYGLILANNLNRKCL